MADTNYPEIDGLKIVHRDSGWEDEWTKAREYLYGHLELLLKYSAAAIRNRSSLWKNENYDSFLMDFVSFLLLEWEKQYGTLPSDKKRKSSANTDKRRKSNYDPELITSTQHPKFITFLLRSIYNCKMVERFIDDRSSTSRLIKKTHKKIVREKGRAQKKSQEEIEKDINISVESIYSNPDDNNSHSERLSDQDKPRDLIPEQGKLQNDIRNMVKQYISSLNAECSDYNESKSIKREYYHAGAQLYPDMTELSPLDRAEDWENSDKKQSVLNQKGIAWIIRKTLNLIEQNNPEQPPVGLLYDIHHKEALSDNCKNDFKSEASKRSITNNPAFQRQFAPIEIHDLRRLFGDDTTTADRSYYMRKVAQWLQDNSDLLNLAFDPDK